MSAGIDERDRLRQGIQQMLKRVPRSIANAGLEATRKYKEAVAAGKKALANPRATLQLLQNAHRNLSVHEG